MRFYYRGMTAHGQANHGHGAAHEPGHAAELAELLDLDAAVLGSYLDEVAAWVERRLSRVPRRVVDVGAGTGTGSMALARRFPAAELVSIDKSPVLLDRLREATREQGLGDRLRVVAADLTVAWPDVGAADLAWAASSLHEFADPDRVLRDIHAALRPGGLLLVIELADLPRFLPDDVGLGRPGLERRCHEVLARLNWNSHPDWLPHLAKAGFEAVGQRTFQINASPINAGPINASTIDPSPLTVSAGRYAAAFLRRIRVAVDGHLATDDLQVLDHLLSDDDPDGLMRRRDLLVRGLRRAWVARRP